jgi:ATP sulfurylase
MNLIVALLTINFGRLVHVLGRDHAVVGSLAFLGLLGDLRKTMR